MKKTLFCFFLLPFFCLSQSLVKDENTGLYNIQKILVFDSISKDRLYNLSYSWIALKYRSANDVIQMSDKESGQIIAKGNFKIDNISASMFYPRVLHTFIIDIKDGKLRCTLTNFKLTCSNCNPLEINLEGYSGAYSGVYNKRIVKSLPMVEDECIQIIKSLEQYIKSNFIKKDEW